MDTKMPPRTGGNTAFTFVTGNTNERAAGTKTTGATTISNTEQPERRQRANKFLDRTVDPTQGKSNDSNGSGHVSADAVGLSIDAGMGKLPHVAQTASGSALQIDETGSARLFADMAPAGEQVLQRRLSAKEAAAINKAHLEGLGGEGRDKSKPAGVGNYKKGDLYKKAKVLRDAGLTYNEIRALMEAGVVGATPADAAHYAIATDLFNGKIVECKPFSANGNLNPLYKVKVYNPETGRTRDALFKARQWGDNEGWDRTPVEYVAYELNRMLGMDLVPPSAYRRDIDAAGMYVNEGVLLYMVPDGHLLGPVSEDQWGTDKTGLLSDTRILDVLIQNSDRHPGNFMRGKHWTDGEYKPVLIDHAAGFRKEAYVSLEHNNAFLTGPVKHIRKSTFEALKALNFDKLKKEFHEFLSDQEIHDVLSRRDGIVNYMNHLIGENGYDKVVLQ